MDPVAAGRIDSAHLLAEPRKVGREDGRGDDDVAWRRTVPHLSLVHNAAALTRRSPLGGTIVAFAFRQFRSIGVGGVAKVTALDLLPEEPEARLLDGAVDDEGERTDSQPGEASKA